MPLHLFLFKGDSIERAGYTYPPPPYTSLFHLNPRPKKTFNKADNSLHIVN